MKYTGASKTVQLVFISFYFWQF